jgi:hypothetical protein
MGLIGSIAEPGCEKEQDACTNSNFDGRRPFYQEWLKGLSDVGYLSVYVQFRCQS